MTDEDVAVEQDEQKPEGQEESATEGQEEGLSEEEQQMAKLKEAISVERESIGSLRVKLSITVPQDTMDERRGEQFAELKRDADIPGFRKGHAPLRLVEKRFASDVGEQLKNQIVGQGYLAAVEKEELKPLGDPLFWVKVKEERLDEEGKPRKVETEKLVPINDAIENIALPKEGPLVFSCELELRPEFELPELEKIPIKRPAVTIEDEDVDEEVDRLRRMRGNFVPVEDGAVEPDDMLYADMKMTVGDELIATEENFDLAARDIRVKGVPLTGFGDAVSGKKIGETLTFEARVPDDHENIDIRGKQAGFTFTIHEIKRLELPELDADLLSSIGFDSEEDLRSTVRSNLEARLDATLKRAMREQIGEYLIEKTTLEIPEGLSQRQTDRTIARRMIDMLQAGIPETEIEKSMDEMRARAHDQVVRDLKLFFILEKIAEDRKVEVSEEQINGAIAEIARQSNKRFDRVRDELSKNDGLMTLYLQLRDQKALDGLVADAEVTETEGPKRKKSAKKKAAKTKAAKTKTAKAKSTKTPAAKAPAAKKKTTKKKAGK